MDKRSRELRLQVLHVLEKSRRGHIGAALSVIEVLRVLYDDILRYNPSDPDCPDRDRFILSKGHACIALYVLLADKGFFPQEELATFCDFESRLGGHPEHVLPGVEASTGALGHGLSIGVGMALAARMDSKDWRTFVLVGDGECNEGSVWEAAMSAGKHELDNLVVMADRNCMQCYGATSEVQVLEPFAEKWQSFGFSVRECNGHDAAAIGQNLKEAPFEVGKPSMLICKTHKGMGFSTTVDNPDWHHKSRLTDEDLRGLREQLEADT